MSRASSRHSSWQRYKYAIPNAMTALRLLLVYPFVQFLLAGERSNAALVFIVALITDADGTVARKLKATTKFGSLFDPIVDLIFALTALTLLVHLGDIAVWAVGAYFASVAIKFVYMQYYFRKNKHVKNSIPSKIVANSASVAIVLGTLQVHSLAPIVFLLIGAVGNIVLTILWFSRR